MSLHSLDVFDIGATETAAPARTRLLLSVPDAERLMLQYRFVTNCSEGKVLAELTKRIGEARLVDPSDLPADIVTMNSHVALRRVDGGPRMNCALVFPLCANPRKGRISVLTPLGAALLGARAGQTIAAAEIGSGSPLVLESVLYQPEAAGDYYG